MPAFNIPRTLDQLGGNLDAGRIANAATASQATFDGLDLVCVGDSLTAGWNLPVPSRQSWPGIISEILHQSVDNRGRSGNHSGLILADLTANVPDPASKCFTLCFGRNDEASGLTLAQLKANTQAAVAYFGSSRYLISTVVYQDTEIIGSPTRDFIANYNAWLLATYPNNTVDIASILLDYYDPSSAGDVADRANGVTPRSLRLPNDNEHLNAAGNAAWAIEILKRLDVFAPNAGPALNPQSLILLLSHIASCGSMTRGNDWTGPQTMWNSVRIAGLTTHLSNVWVNGTGFGIYVDGATYKRFGIAQFDGHDPSFVRSTGNRTRFLKSSNSLDASDLAATKTIEAEWTDNQFKYLSTVWINGSTPTFAIDGATFKRLGIVQFSGSAPSFYRSTGAITTFSKSSNNLDATDSAATRTSELDWSDDQFRFKSSLWVNGATPTFAIDGATFKRLAIVQFSGSSPSFYRSSGSTTTFSKSSSTTDATDSAATRTSELAWDDSGWQFNTALKAASSLSVGGGSALTKILPASATLDFPSIAAGGQQELTISVTGAAVGSAVASGPPTTLGAGLTVDAWVSAADTVKIRLSNITGSPIDPASATYKVVVFNP